MNLGLSFSAATFKAFSDAAFEHANTGGEALLTDAALLAGLKAIGITVEDERARFVSVEQIWVERTWRDVREGDVIRPAGPGDIVSRHEAEVVTLGATQHWHAAPDANEYRPNESPMEWASIPVTLEPLAGGAAFSPPNGMNPDAPVQIRVTRGELAAIQACGGWGQRISVTASYPPATRPVCACCGRAVAPLDDAGRCGHCGANRDAGTHVGDQPCRITGSNSNNQDQEGR